MAWIKEWTWKKKYSHLLWTVCFLMTGFILNSVVILSNDCVMPVVGDWDIDTENHRTLDNFEDVGKVEWIMFSDIYQIGDIIILSLGDIFMAIGVVLVVNGLVIHGIIPELLKVLNRRKSWNK